MDFTSELAVWPELGKVVENARRLERQEAGAAHLEAQAALDVAIAEDRARLDGVARVRKIAGMIKYPACVGAPIRIAARMTRALIHPT